MVKTTAKIEICDWFLFVREERLVVLLHGALAVLHGIAATQ